MARGNNTGRVAADSSSDEDGPGSSNRAPRSSYKKFSAEDYNDHNQPLTDAGASKLNNLKLEWTSDATRIEGLLATLSEAAEELGEAYADEEAGEEWQRTFAELDRRAKAIVDSVNKSQCYAKALHAVRQRVLKQEDVLDAPREVDEQFNAYWTEYEAQTERQKYGKSKGYADFRSKLWGIFRPESSMPAVASLLPRGAGEESDSEDDIERGEATIAVKCPITLEIMTDPYTCSLCRHSYSKKGFEDYIRNAPTRGVACPVAGCSSIINRQNTRPNDELRKRIKRYVSRKEREKREGHVLGDQDSENEGESQQKPDREPSAKSEDL